MRALDAQTLLPGSRLPGAVFTRQGLKLLGTDVTLNEAMCRTLRSFNGGPLYLAGSVRELRDAGVIRGEADARVELGGVLAHEPGVCSEPRHLDALEAGPLVGLSARDCARLRSQRVRLAEGVAADREGRWSRLAHRIPAYEPAITGDDEPGWPGSDELLEWRGARVRALRRVLVRVLTGAAAQASDFESLGDELEGLARRFPGRFVQVALCARACGEYLPDHAYTTGVLSVAIASRLGWSADHVRLAALSGMLADTGMGLVPSGVRISVRGLDDVDANRVRRHPAYSVSLLDAVEGLSDEVMRAAYQHHERENGTGYPRALRGEQISDMAKVVGVADTFAAAVAPRPYRAGKRPYDALEELVRLGARRVLDRRCVRALVEAMGLFPIGSFVRLSTGDVAEVVGMNPTALDRPVVKVVHRSGGAERTLDLAGLTTRHIRVVRAADRPGVSAA